MVQFMKYGEFFMPKMALMFRFVLKVNFCIYDSVLLAESKDNLKTDFRSTYSRIMYN